MIAMKHIATYLATKLCYSIMYVAYLVLGIVWVVLSGVSRLDEMAVTTGLSSESRLVVLAGPGSDQRLSVLPPPAASRTTKNPCCR